MKKTMLIIIVALLLFCGLIYADIIKIPFIKYSSQNSQINNYEVSYPDVEEYYNETSELLEIVTVDKSADLLSEMEAVHLLEDRGFTMGKITSEYEIDGTYYDEIEIDPLSLEKHPVYNTLHQTDDGEIWIITIIGSQIMATPIQYNYEHPDLNALVSDQKYVTGYDSYTNSFYVNIPNQDYIHVEVIESMDANTLNSVILGE
mgnify:CR=1 FL=1